MAVDRQLPTGTATFLFTDIENSTRSVQALGTERWQDVLTDHARIIRAAAGANGGVEVRTEGDSFFYVFPLAPAAVEAAVEAQRRIGTHTFPHGATVRVRMGMHTGAATVAPGESGTDYVGFDVHRAARIAASGHGGQILVSEATRGLIDRSLPADVTLRDLGEHHLKDLARPERIHQVVAPGLADRFPPLRTLDAIPNNFPTQLTSFIGRRHEIDEGLRLLAATRLLTLTGPGGTGKTRLALQVGAEAAGEFPGGAYWVPLATIRDPDLVGAEIATTLGLPDNGDRPMRDRLVERVRDRKALLVLDNFEQVIAAGPFVADLLRECPLLKIIVSSRTALRVYGEQELPVPPLGLPDLAHLPPIASLSQFEAVRLFIERAANVKPDFQVTNENAPAVAQICTMLDGLPLAIELAAARIKILTPAAMLERLEQGLGMLAGGARDLPARQQTLRGAIGWSYDLLDEGLRRVFERLSVFAGGGELPEIEPVVACGDLGVELIDGLATLVDQSLLRQRDVAGAPRFLMLQTIREYAADRLAERPDRREVERRHAEAYLAFADRTGPKMSGAQDVSQLDALEREQDNFRAALGWCVEQAETSLALRYLYALWRFWQMRGHLREGRAQADRVLALPDAASHAGEHAKALEAAGGIAYWQGDVEATKRFYRAAYDTWKELGDKHELANAAYNLSFPDSFEGQERSLLDRSAEHLTEALALFREVGDRRGVANTLWALSDNLNQRDRTDEALALLEECIGLFEELGDWFGRAWALYGKSLGLIVKRDLAGALAVQREALERFAEHRDASGVPLLLDAIALTAFTAGDRQRALRLHGAAMKLATTAGVGLPSVAIEAKQRGIAPIDLTGPDVAAGLAAGEALDMDAAIALALATEVPSRA